MESLAWGLNLAVLAIFFTLVPRLPRERTWARSLVVVVVLGLWCRYFVWRMTSTTPAEQPSGSWPFFFVALALEMLMFLSMALFLATLCRYVNRSPEADRHEKRLRSLPPERLPTVNVFIPTYNEDREIVERGIVAAKELDYPRFRVWVLDDGRRDWLRDLCAERKVGYIRRPDNRHAKAGNVNHALTVTNGELFVVFDADFTPHRNFLYRTVGFFFADPRVSIVQTPQHFYNPDVFQVNLGLSDVMQDNEREWFDEILCSRDAWDCAFCCGTCAVFRRDAIEKIGGIATESVTEDILTTVRLLPSGLLTRYLNERLSIGMAPENANSLLIQRRRWTRGHIQMMFLMLRKYGSGLTLRQWLLFLPFHYLLEFSVPTAFRPVAVDISVDGLVALLREINRRITRLPGTGADLQFPLGPLVPAACPRALAFIGDLFLSLRSHFPNRRRQPSKTVWRAVPRYTQGPRQYRQRRRPDRDVGTCRPHYADGRRDHRRLQFHGAIDESDRPDDRHLLGVMQPRAIWVDPSCRGPAAAFARRGTLSHRPARLADGEGASTELHRDRYVLVGGVCCRRGGFRSG